MLLIIEGSGTGQRSVVLAEDFVTGEYLSDDPNDADNWFFTATRMRVTAVVDVNNDHVDEVIIEFGQYESWGSVMYEWDTNTQAFRKVLSAGCGV